MSSYKTEKPISEMTEEEKVDETFRRLKYPPTSDDYAEALLKALSKEIAAEIDKEILRTLRELK